MRARDVARGVGVVAVVVAVVLAATFAGGLLLSSSTDASTAPEAPAYDTNELRATPLRTMGRDRAQ